MVARNSPWRIPLLVTGGLLVVLSPVVGIVPGPGGIFVFAGGLVLLLRNSASVKKAYVRLTRTNPRLGAYADRALRRPSWKRRQAIAAARKSATD